MTAIEYQVAAHGPDAIGAQLTQQQPEFLHVQLGIVAALEVQVAVQRAIDQRPVAVELGLPLMIGTEQLQGGIGGDQLHGRGRVDRDVGVHERRRVIAVER